MFHMQFVECLVRERRTWKNFATNPFAVKSRAILTCSFTYSMYNTIFQNTNSEFPNQILFSMHPCCFLKKALTPPIQCCHTSFHKNILLRWIHKYLHSCLELNKNYSLLATQQPSLFKSRFCKKWHCEQRILKFFFTNHSAFKK